jgi:hypothetical protein
VPAASLHSMGHDATALCLAQWASISWRQSACHVSLHMPAVAAAGPVAALLQARCWAECWHAKGGILWLGHTKQHWSCGTTLAAAHENTDATAEVCTLGQHPNVEHAATWRTLACCCHARGTHHSWLLGCLLCWTGRRAVQCCVLPVPMPGSRCPVPNEAPASCTESASCREHHVVCVFLGVAAAATVVLWQTTHSVSCRAQLLMSSVLKLTSAPAPMGGALCYRLVPFLTQWYGARPGGLGMWSTPERSMCANRLASWSGCRKHWLLQAMTCAGQHVTEDPFCFHLALVDESHCSGTGQAGRFLLKRV